MSNIVDLQERREEIARNEARDHFGSWDDWAESDIRYLLQELSDGHWEDCGEKVPGFAIATGGLNIAIAADEGELDNRTLRMIVNGMWAAADYLTGWLGPDEMDPRLAASLEAVYNACAWTGEAGPDSLGITRCRPRMR